MKAPVVVITDFCLNHVGYFDWLVTGFGMLSEQGKIGFRFDLPLSKRALRHRQIRWAAKALSRNWVNRVNGTMWWMEGHIDFGGKKIRFVFDVTDHGNSWDRYALERTDLYFKCQLPSSFPDPLQINRSISCEMPAHAIEHALKIRPAMLGRPLSRKLDLRKNYEILKQWESAASVPRSKRIFAYFGGDQDPEQAKYAGFPYEHPNCKRANLVRFLRSLNDDRVDARLVKSVDPSLEGQALNDDASYSKAVATAEYNLNIAGFSRSIPFRFIDSFVAGTAILTDSLAIRWYEPFDQEREVIDLGVMGYELASDVNWPDIEQRLKQILTTPASAVAENRAYLLDRYRKYWAPSALASYIVQASQAIAG